MKTIGVRDLKNHVSEYLRSLSKDEPVVITRNGKPVAAMISLEPDELEDFILAHSPKVQKMVRKGIKEIKRGEFFTVDELMASATIELED
ncbi:MAG: type II toxin-antitoxin system Phd/YefM family antitoxin [Actinobacteria bacterium]|nr:type II toxin-antitoxin system Phd/YefM family antitoxin [Actinomycetota bacterium]MCG2794674.1 type II toxin-antitoxin system Phd/YefM family antitoxin [Actinomycetes bacterium]